MNPWQIILDVIGWGILAIIVFFLAAILIALLKAITGMFRRKRNAPSTHIFKSGKP